MDKNKALVLLSGGQDSTTCLFWAKEYYDYVETIIIDYGQRHKIEIESAKKISEIADMPYNFFKTDILKDIKDSPLVSQGDVKKIREGTSLPSSFVPGRNVLFLVIASVLAYKKKINNVVIGVCQTDYSGYPDCREETVESITQTCRLGMDFPLLKIQTPLMYLTKKETVALAYTLPGCLKALAYSHTCYEGKYPPCGECPACKLREKGFKEARIKDPLIERCL